MPHSYASWVFLFLLHFLFSSPLLFRASSSLSYSPYVSCIFPFWGCFFDVRLIFTFFSLRSIGNLLGFLIFFFSFLFWGFRTLPLFFRFLGSMVGNFEVRILFPSVSFLFAHLGASLGVSCTFCPLVEGFWLGVVA